MSWQVPKENVYTLCHKLLLSRSEMGSNFSKKQLQVTHTQLIEQKDLQSFLSFATNLEAQLKVTLTQININRYADPFHALI